MLDLKIILRLLGSSGLFWETKTQTKQHNHKITIPTTKVIAIWVCLQNNTPNYIVKATPEEIKNSNSNVLEWLSQKPHINPVGNLWLDLKKAVHS